MDVETNRVVVVGGVFAGRVANAINVLGQFSPDGMSLSIAMHPREELMSIGRMVFLLLTFFSCCKKSRRNGLIG